MRDTVVSGGDAAQLLELADGPLDPVAQLVFDRIEGSVAWHAGALRDDRLRAGCFDKVKDCVGVVGFVGQNVTRIETCQQRDSQLGIAGIAAGQNEAYRAAERIDRDVPLGGQSSSGAPQSLVARPPFWPVAAWA